ncbi:Flp family type IVb pilin [Ferrimonas sp. YFM]|uniref:Flp family type IVb pilin n=1 Tax=Ferrimonas sp. YFM TaxID=3028878 RepID=UPI0025734EF0|nr:Flp family type IVb pilin [Ferrimonas sp. YFM]BDY04214.1 fimbrial protein [Ferrimonas sp. YFM]
MIKTYAKAQAALTTFKRDERGVTAIEYGLIGVAMAVILGVAFANDGAIFTSLKQAFGTIGTMLGEQAVQADG